MSKYPLVSARRHIAAILNGTTATQTDPLEHSKLVTRIETISGGEISYDRVGYVDPSEDLERYRLKFGDLLLSHINSMSMIGNCAIYEDEKQLHVGMNLLRVRCSDAAHPRFLFYCFRSSFGQHQVKSFAKPAINQASISTANLKRILLPLPDLDTQKAIADFLDRETARVDQLIEKKQRFLTLTTKRIDALVDEAISDPSVPRLRFENVVRRMQRPVVLSDHEELVRLGLFNRGRGMFKKPAADEEGMGDSSFCFVREGDLILSGQFAWEGAVALATEDEDGCVVSHRYPVYRGRDGINTAYLLGLFRSGFGDFLLNEASRGSAGRNRPLNTWRLGKEKIPVPTLELQEAVDCALAFERQLKKKTEHSIRLLTEALAALITAAVTGQIDVATWGKQGQTDRRLDEIEEAMQA